MSTYSETLYLSVSIQLLLTVCLGTLLWALYTRLQRFEFFRWWAWAWTASAAYLALAALSLHLGPALTTQKAGVILLMLLFGFLQPVLLVFGGLSWRRPTRLSGRLTRWGIALACIIAMLCFAASMALRSSPMAAFSIRSAPRSFGLAAALLFCCTVFWRQFRKHRSYASAITGVFCLSYAFNHCIYFLSVSEILFTRWNLHFPVLLHRFANLQMFSQSKLLFLDLVDTCGICVGMILLLVERYQHTATELQVSERRRLGLAEDKASLQTEIQFRQQAEQQLRRSEEFSHQVILNSPVAMVVARGQSSTVELVNEKFTSLSGYTLDDVHDIGHWWPRAYPDPEYRKSVKSQWQKLIEMANHGSAEKLAMEARVCCRDGSFRDVELHISLVDDLYLISLVDLTERKRAEQELKEHAMYMDALISNIPLGIVIKDQDRLVRFCNAPFEQMFQFTQAEIQGKNLDDLIAPHDRQEAALLSDAVQKGGVVHATARRRRKDGTLIDVEVFGVKVFSGDSFIGAFCIYQDITERKKSEEKLIALRYRLSRAQEEERARIARDLHDDAGQRLALLSIDLEQLKQTSMKLKSSLTQQLEALVKAASEITSDVHNVSRRLHPSQVELLGLAPALSNFCKDFAARNSMEIEFVNAGLQQKPPVDSALCLFRVAQEAVRNVQKHSGIRRALIQLDEISGSLRLRISDQGAGFDPQSADFSQGLGLLSMEERLHSLGGELFIHSRPGGGTCVEACVPLSPAVPAEY